MRVLLSVMDFVSHNLLGAYMPTTNKRRVFKVDFLNTTKNSVGAVTVVPSANTVIATDSRTHEGPVYNYKQKLKAGQYAGTYLFGTRYTVESKKFAVYFKRSSLKPTPLNPYTVFAAAQGTGFYLSAFESSNYASLVKADNQAKAKAVREIRRQQTSFQGGVFLGELGETLRALRSPARTLREGISDYFATLKKRKRGIRGSANKRRHALKDILANTWLEYSFGWKPLVSDIDSAAETLANHMHRTDAPEMRRFDATGDDEFAIPFQGEALYSNGPAGIYYRMDRMFKYSVHYFGMLNVEHPYKVGARRLGLDLSNFLPTAWELTPWSFLVDYFTNIGDIISAATLVRSDVRWMMKTVRSESSRIARTTRFIPFPSNTSTTFQTGSCTCRPGNSVWTKTDVTRTKYEGSLVPSLDLRIPGFGTKWINMAALAVTQSRLRPYY